MNLSFSLAACLTFVALSATAQTRHTDRVDAETATGTRVKGIPSDAMGRCNDGMFSKATSKSSACASHGGLKIWYSDNNDGHPAGPTPARTSSDPDMAVGELVSGVPSDATAKCKDGTFSKAGKKVNACKQHNGLSIWYPGG